MPMPDLQEDLDEVFIAQRIEDICPKVSEEDREKLVRLVVQFYKGEL